MTDTDTPVPTIDVDIPRFNQAVVAALTAVAFVFQLEWLVAATFAILAVSVVGGPRVAPLTWVYRRLVRPLVSPDGPREVEPAAPPRFAQLLGAAVLGVASLLLAVGAEAVGWGLTLLVTALAALAATTRICVGCIIYRKAVAR